MQKVKYNDLPSYQHPSEVINNLDSDQASIVVFPDIMYTYRDTQGGSKLKTFSKYLTFVTVSS